MGYVDKNLISDETVTYRARLHWSVLLGPGIIATVFVFAGVFIATQSVILLGFGFMVLGVMPLISALIRRSAAEFAVTNKRVILKTGVIQRRTTEMFLGKIESIGIEQTILGRMLGYGSIVVHGTGGSSEPFDFIAPALEFRRQVQEQIGKTTEAVMSNSWRPI
jgi:uncharacterized membrane protein YdbT with pleckstrin-like domain